MFKGSIPALITPFKNGKVDYDSLEKLVEWQISEGSSTIRSKGFTSPSIVIIGSIVDFKVNNYITNLSNAFLLGKNHSTYTTNPKNTLDQKLL